MYMAKAGCSETLVRLLTILDVISSHLIYLDLRVIECKLLFLFSNTF